MDFWNSAATFSMYSVKSILPKDLNAGDIQIMESVLTCMAWTLISSKEQYILWLTNSWKQGPKTCTAVPPSTLP